MANPITLEQVSKDVLNILDGIVEELYSEDERSEAKVRILDAFSASMFQESKEKNT